MDKTINKETIKLFEDMNNINKKMVDKIEKALNEERPRCHFTFMEYEDGYWVCPHCGHEKESEVKYND